MLLTALLVVCLTVALYLLAPQFAGLLGDRSELTGPFRFAAVGLAGPVLFYFDPQHQLNDRQRGVAVPLGVEAIVADEVDVEAQVGQLGDDFECHGRDGENRKDRLVHRAGEN